MREGSKTEGATPAGGGRGRGAEPRAEPGRRAIARRLVVVAASLAGCIGAAYLAFWLAGLPPRWSARGTITMKPNAALAMILTSVATLLLRPGAPAGRRRTAALVAGSVLAIGLATLAEHLLGVDLGIDQLIATEPPGQPGATSPNRMGPPAATSFTLLGLGLLARAARRRASAYAGVAVCCIVLVPAIGFVYRIGELYSEALTGIAWPTVVALFSLGLALALAEPETGPTPALLRDDPGGALLRGLLGPTLVLPLVLGFLRVEGERRGLYPFHVGTALYATAVVVVFGLMLWRTAARLSAVASERQRVEAAAREELRASEEQHRALARDRQLALDAARMGWWHYDPVTRVSTYDERYQQIFGVAGHERPNDEILKLLHPQDLSAVWRAVEAALDPADPRPYSAQYRIIRPDGALRWVEAHGVAVFEGDGAARRATGLVGTVEDVTDRNEAEAAVQAANARLVDADRRKDEFLGMLSHELRNPLAPIRNALYILERAEPGGPKAARALEVANRQIGHLARLVDDLLDVTRIARGLITLRRAEVDLAAVARRVADDHRALFAERGVELQVALPAEALRTNGDETRLVQVLGNLLHNAAKFTPPGGRVELTVAAAGDAAVIRVRDSGAGIEPALLPLLFEPFTQGRQDLARTQGGLGLGLALVRSLVAMHGGEVRAHSDGPGHGAEFVVSLPLLAPGGGRREDAAPPTAVA